MPGAWLDKRSITHRTVLQVLYIVDDDYGMMCCAKAAIFCLQGVD